MVGIQLKHQEDLGWPMESTGNVEKNGYRRQKLVENLSSINVKDKKTTK